MNTSLSLVISSIPKTGPLYKKTALQLDQLDLLFVHGITDAPAVDLVRKSDGVALLENLAFGEFAEMVGVEPVDFTVNIVTSTGMQGIALGKIKE